MNWLKQLEKSVVESKVVNKIPKEWFCTQDYATKTGRHTSSASKIISELFKQGKLERKVFYRLLPNGRPYPAPYYRFK